MVEENKKDRLFAHTGVASLTVLSTAKDKELWKKFQGYGKIRRHKLAELIINHHLSNPLFGLFIKLLTMAHHKTGVLSTCLRELLGVAGCCRNTLQKDMRKLVEKGLIKYRNPKARWRKSVSYSTNEAPYVLEICNYSEYFEGADNEVLSSTGTKNGQVKDSTCKDYGQVVGNTCKHIGQVTPSTCVNVVQIDSVTHSNQNHNNPLNKHNNKQYNKHHQEEDNNTCTNVKQVLFEISDDDVSWLQEEFKKRTNNHGTSPFLENETCANLLRIYGRETVAIHLLRLDFKKSNNPPGLFINSLENPQKYTCLRMPSEEERMGERRKKEEEKIKKEKEKRDAEEKERQEYEKKKERWNAMDNTTRRRYFDSAREEIIEENKGANPDVMKMCLMDLNVHSRAMNKYFSDREKDVCRI